MLLLTLAPAGSVATVMGDSVNAKRLAHQVTLPNGQKSRYTVTLGRESDDANAKGYAVKSTGYFESLNFSDYTPVTRAAAVAVFNDDFVHEGKLVYKRLHSGDVTYNVLSRVCHDDFGE